jgi:hypothetical protein
VMDYRNKAIPNPDAFAVNTAMQRCLAKAIALHGIGLYIYAGEDLPQEDAVVSEGEFITLEEMIVLSKDLEELKKNFAYAYKVVQKDKVALAKINKAKEDRKAQLA